MGSAKGTSFMSSNKEDKDALQLTLAEHIRREMDGFTPSEKRAAHVLLSNYPFAGLETVADFAEQVGVSSPSILRFVSRLGFEGFPEFQKHLRDELAAQMKSPLNRSDDASESRQDESALQITAESMISNMHATIDGISSAEFEAVVNLLTEENKRVYLSGGRYTGSLARFAEGHFLLLRKNVFYLDPHADLWRERMLDIGRRDVLLVYDIRRYSNDLLRLCETASAQGATVVLITDAWLSPITRVAKYVLPAQIETHTTWDTVAGLLLITETLISVMTQDLWRSARKRIRSIDQLREEGV